MIKDIHPKGKIIPASKNLKMENGAEDALVVDIFCNEESRRLELTGGSGFVSAKSKFELGGLNFAISYGAKYLQTPFFIKVERFSIGPLCRLYEPFFICF